MSDDDDEPGTGRVVEGKPLDEVIADARLTGDRSCFSRSLNSCVSCLKRRVLIVANVPRSAVALT